MSEIASVSIARPLDEVAAELGKSFEEYGFAVIRDHGIPQDLIDRAEAMSKAFFALPTDTKKAYQVSKAAAARAAIRRSGSRPRRTRRSTISRSSGTSAASCPQTTRYAEFMGPNVWPAEVAGFREPSASFTRRSKPPGRACSKPSRFTSILPREWFAATVKDGNSVMRLLHYPPLKGSDAEGAIRAAAHGDINTITLLLGAEEAGLELLTASGDWKAIDVPPGALVVNIGDMLDRLTNHKLRSTTHRVMNPVGEAAYRARYSMPFFLHFRPDFTIRNAARLHRPGAARRSSRTDLEPRISPAAPARDQARLGRVLAPMESAPTRFGETSSRPRWWVIALVVLAHLLAFYGLIRVFAPDAVRSVESSVLATFNVTIAAPPPPPAAAPKPDEGAAGERGKKAVPKPVTAPKPKIPIKQDTPMPRASSTGTANSSGAKDSGAGTGASGSGEGTGSGRGGGGQGGVADTKPVKIAGDIQSSADFPIPPGGRSARFGTSVTVYMTIGIDGRASNCRVVRPSPDSQADAIVCRLAVQRFRFRPAIDSNGNPVPATYGWRQQWFPT